MNNNIKIYGEALYESIENTSKNKDMIQQLQKELVEITSSLINNIDKEQNIDCLIKQAYITGKIEGLNEKVKFVNDILLYARYLHDGILSEIEKENK